MGLISSVFLFSVALLAVPTAYLADRWGRRRTLGLMAFFWSIFTFFTGMASNFTTLLLPRSLVGVGEAGFAGAGAAAISAAYPQRMRGRVLGIFAMAIILGAGIGMILGGFIGKQMGWRAPFFIFPIPGIILGILAFFMRDYKAQPDTLSGEAGVSFWKSLVTLVKIRTLAWVLLGYGISNIMSMALMAWGPAYICRAWNVDIQVASNSFVLVIVVGLIGAPLGGYLSDIWFRNNIKGRLFLPSITVFTSSILGILAIYMEFRPFWGMLCGVLWGILAVMSLPAVWSACVDVAPVALRGSTGGIMLLCLYVLGGGWAPWLVGIISKSLGESASSLGTALMLASLTGIMGCMCYFVSAGYYASDIEKVKGESLISEK
jgi:MFS family permease